MQPPISNQKVTFNHILRRASLANFQQLFEKAELAASLAGPYPKCRNRLLEIRRHAQNQLDVIAGGLAAV